MPPFRSLDIYRLFVVRRLRQLDVANSFGVHPSRISQIVRLVRDWVNDCVGDWLFPGRDDLRFYVALELVSIRVTEFEAAPQQVILAGPRCTYTRHEPNAQAQSISASLLPANSAAHPDARPPQTTQPALNLSPQPINSATDHPRGPLATTPDATTDSIPPHIRQMGLRIAQLLILWKKHQNLGAALKPMRFSPR